MARRQALNGQEDGRIGPQIDADGIERRPPRLKRLRHFEAGQQLKRAVLINRGHRDLSRRSCDGAIRGEREALAVLRLAEQLRSSFDDLSAGTGEEAHHGLGGARHAPFDAEPCDEFVEESQPDAAGFSVKSFQLLREGAE